jgi:hypothetical protein
MPLFGLALPNGRTKLPPLKIKWIKKIYGSWVGRPVGLNRMSQGRSDRTICTCAPMPVANDLVYLSEHQLPTRKSRFGLELPQFLYVYMFKWRQNHKPKGLNFDKKHINKVK